MPIIRLGANTADDFTGGVVDTMIEQGAPTTNFGTDPEINVEKWGASDWIHGLIAFPDLTTIIASGSTINSATLTLTIEGGAGGTHTVTITRMLRAWVDTQATWNVYTTGNSWTSGGASSDGNDHENDQFATITGIGATPGDDYTSGDLSAIVQGWVDGTYPNYGLRLERTDGGADSTYRVFWSSEGTDGFRPYLTVDYTAADAPAVKTLAALGVG